MITLLFCMLMFVIFGKLAMIAIRAAWGITKVIIYLILAPLVLIIFLFSGFIYVAFILLMVGGVVGILSSRIW